MGEAATLLVVEDNAHDVFLLKRAFIKAGINVPMHIVNDGQEAVDYLIGQEPYANRKEYPLPTLLLLDLKMPRLSGFDVIRWVREHKGLRRLPILVLSSSGLGKDVNRAYDLGANSYLLKPSRFEDLEVLAEDVERYWCQRNRGPESLDAD